MKEKDLSDPQPDSAIQSKARRLLHMDARVLRAPYMIKILGLELLTASRQPEVLGGLLDISEGRSTSSQKDALTT